MNTVLACPGPQPTGGYFVFIPIRYLVTNPTTLIKSPRHLPASASPAGSVQVALFMMPAGLPKTASNKHQVSPAGSGIVKFMNIIKSAFKILPEVAVLCNPVPRRLEVLARTCLCSHAPVSTASVPIVRQSKTFTPVINVQFRPPW